MKAKLLTTVLVALSVFTGVSSGAIIPVVNDSDSSLYIAVRNASSGDVLELTVDGIYALKKRIDIEKNIVIRGAASLTNKPVLKFTGNTGGTFFKIIENSKVTFENLEMNGIFESYTAKYPIIVDTSTTARGSIVVKIKDCIIHDFTDKFFRPYKKTNIDTLLVTNTIFHHGGTEGIVLHTGSTADGPVYLQYAQFDNCTFYALQREAIKGQVYTGTKVRINHCTFYDIGEAQKKQMLYFSDMTDVVVKNSIFVKNHNLDLAEQFTQFASAAAIFKNNIVYDVYNWAVKNATVSDTLHVDPQFLDAANANFTFQNPVLLTYADDGGPVGDLRWVPTGKVMLTVNVVGQGYVTLNPAGGFYDKGTVVTLTAIPADLWAFDGWSENVTVFPPKNPVAQVTVNDNLTVTAYFIPTVVKRNVTVHTVGLGHIEVIEHEKIIADGIFDGDTLIFTAVPDTATWEFAYWMNTKGDSLGKDNPSTLIVNADTIVTALFRSTLPQVALNITVDGLGKVTVTPPPLPGFSTYDQGTEVTLTAEALVGWEFNSWSGDITGTEKVKTITLTTNITAVAHFMEIAVPNGELLVDNDWDIREALGFAKNNSQVKVIKLISTGPFMPAETERDANGKLPQLNIDFPVTIVGAENLATKPIIKGWGEGGSEGLFRLRENGHITLRNLEVDGSYTPGKVTKYIFRLDDGKDINVSVKADRVDFHGTTEVFLKFYALVHADTLRFTNCVIWDIGKEAIFDNAVGTTDYIEVRNCTFHHVGREVVRLSTQTPKTIIDHVTIDNCGYGFGTEGAKFAAFRFEMANNVIITNTIISNVLNSSYNYSVRITGKESRIDNCLLFNTPRIDNKNSSIIGKDVYWYDPMFLNPLVADYTLKDSSFAYHLAGDGSKAIGDLRWATSTNPATFYTLNIAISGPGKVTVNPLPITKFYLPGTIVTLTVQADTLYKFGSWSGDLTGTTAPTNLTMNANKNVVANFVKAYFAVELNVNMSYWAELGKFRVGVDSVDAAGTFNGWAGGAWLKDADGDTIYTTIVKIDENFPQFEWKFRINGTWNDATCEFPYGGPNRVFVAISDTSLTFWYNNDLPQVGLVTELLPERYELQQNYPNPFNPSTTIKFSLKQEGFTTLTVYDLLGKEVARLVSRDLKAGYHQVVFANNNLPSGVYIYKLTSGNYTAIKKMMLMK